MNRLNARSNIQNNTNTEDPRLKSKVSTPKRIDKCQKNEEYDNYSQDEKTHFKQPQRLSNFYLKDSIHEYNNDKYDDHSFQMFEKAFERKKESFDVLAGTLREYIKEQKVKQKPQRKYLPIVVQIIKAYTKSQIKQVSPNVTQLIHKILDTLPISKQRGRKKSKQGGKNKSKGKQSQSIVLEPSLHKKEQNVEIKPEKEKKKIGNKITEQILLKQVRSLEQTLNQLRKQSQILQQMQTQFQQMNEGEKREYITELEQIVKKQKQLILQYDSQGTY